MSKFTSRIHCLLAIAVIAGSCGGQSEQGMAGAGGSVGTGGDTGSAGAGPGTGGAMGGGGMNGGGGTTGSGGAAGGVPTGSGCDAVCAVATGITLGCEKRFLYGVNYAWRSFAGDFGGTRGVSANLTNVTNNLNDMHANGVDAVRWWVWPGLNAGNVVLDGSGTPTGLGPTVMTDLAAALQLAGQIGLHVQFTLFSFDNFKPDTMTTKSIRPIVVDAAKRAALMNVAVRPFARAVAASAQAAQAIGWDVINEPEWAISGSNGYGDVAYTPQTNLQTVTQTEMEAFVSDVITALRAESTLPITVGSAAAKWPKAWSKVDVDFYTIHIYDWVNMYWPYTMTPAQLGFSGKPVVMGEFPVGGLTGVPYATMVSALYSNGYAGAMGWAVTDTSFNWPTNKVNVKSFADSKGCVVRF